MAPVHLQSVSSVLIVFLSLLPGVYGEEADSSLAGLVAAGAIAFIFLCVVVAMLIIGGTWHSWYPALQRAKGRVKMPREYWKKKKEAKARLLNGVKLGSTRAASENGIAIPNGAPVNRTQETGKKPAEWVQGWNNANPPVAAGRGEFEEMALAMDLGEEDNRDEFRIETTVVDDEALDLGPFRDSGTSMVPNPNITVPRAATPSQPATAGGDVILRAAGRPSSSESKTRPGTSSQTVTMEMTEDGDDGGYLYSTVERASIKSAGQAGEEAVTSFSKRDSSIVHL